MPSTNAAPENARGQVGSPDTPSGKKPRRVSARTVADRKSRRRSFGNTAGGVFSNRFGMSFRKTSQRPPKLTSMLAMAGRNIQRAYSAKEMWKRLETTMLIG